jgi:FixJ family two-component response regulator
MRKFLTKSSDTAAPTEEQMQQIKQELTQQEATVLLKLLQDKEAKQIAFNYLLQNLK